jgi:Domain of unknown function (DUF4136)
MKSGPALAVSLIVLSLATVAAVDVNVQFDKKFDFKSVKTWAWDPKPGDVLMARASDDDPEAMRKMAEPLILDAVATEMGRRGFQLVQAGSDIRVTYYLLLTTTMSAQVAGQFMPAAADWHLPLFPSSTQSLKMMNQGALVLDLSAGGQVVCRGVASAQVKFDADAKKRESLIREAVRDLVRRFPPR